MFVETDRAQDLTDPAGWTVILDQQGRSHLDTAQDTRAHVYWKRAGASESAPSIADSGDHTIAIIVAFRGCKISDSPVDTSASNNPVSGTSIACPTITTSVANALVIAGAMHGGNTTFSSWSNGNLSSLGEILDFNDTSGNDGSVGLAIGWKAAAGAVGTTTVTVAEGVMATFQIALIPAPNAYSLTATGGAFTETGTAATLLKSSLVSAGAGEYALTGTAASLLASFLVGAEPGEFTFTGSDVTLTKTTAGLYVLTADGGAFTLSGTAAGLLKSALVLAGAGEYTLTGTAASLLKSSLVAAEPGEFTLTGQDVEFTHTTLDLIIHDLIHGVSVTNINLITNKALSVDPGAFTVTGTAATFLKSYLLAASPGAFTLTGSTVLLIREIPLVVHDVIHGITIDTPTLVAPGIYSVTVHDSVHGVIIDGGIDLTLILPKALTVHDAIHDITIDHIAPIPPVSLTVHDAIHGITIARAPLRGFEYGEVVTVINIGGAWKLIEAIKILINGAWKTITGITLRQ
jgi:hypothetical protein